MDMLRIFTAGSVDDGKSTLIGRLLHDTNAVMQDQMAAVEKASKQRGLDEANLALLTDGLKDERDLGITIDVAYRYFATPRRKFIMADTPGHVQYTRNMVTGASNANLAIVLVDACKGVLEQTRRHCFISALLQVPHIVVCVNKMDLVGYGEAAFNKIRDEISDYAAKLDVHDIRFIPISALKGDMVSNRSKNMNWYQGPTLLSVLESIHIASDRNLIDARFAVQVVQPHRDADNQIRRFYLGTVLSGALKPGDEITVLPSGFSSKVKSLQFDGKDLERAFAPMSAAIELEDEIDVQRGDVICRSNNQPEVAQELDAMICWMDQKPLQMGKQYTIQQVARQAKCLIKDLNYCMDVNTLSKDPDKQGMELNEIGRIKLRTSTPMMTDPYHRNRQTGSFILIDPVTKGTVAAGMVN